MTHSAAPRVPLFCSYHILTSSVIFYWTDARQHGIYLLNGVHWRHKQIALLKLGDFVADYTITTNLKCFDFQTTQRRHLCGKNMWHFAEHHLPQHICLEWVKVSYFYGSGGKNKWSICERETSKGLIKLSCNIVSPEVWGKWTASRLPSKTFPMREIIWEARETLRVWLFCFKRFQSHDQWPCWFHETTGNICVKI